MAQRPGTDAAHRVLDAALDAAGEEQAVLNAAAGRRTVALADAVAAATAAPAALLDVEVERVASAPAGRRSSVAWRALVAEVACALGVSEHVAQGWLADAETLASKATGTLGLLRAGRISYAHAAKLADVVADLPAPVAAQVEDAVLARAPGLTPARLAALARRVRDRLHPVPAEVRREAAALKAGVWVDDGADGMSWLTAHVPTPVAHAAYDRLTRTAARAKTSGDPRGVGQLRAATLTALLLDDARAESSPAGPAETARSSDELVSTDTGPPDPPDVPDALETLARTVRPVVHVNVPVTTLTGAGEAPATLNGTTPLDAETARHLAARAPTLRRVLTDPVTGALLTVERRSYTVPADLKAFLTQRDLTCRFPGCRLPAPRCDLDHTRAWADGGATSAGNLAHLCRKHHTLKHESRWQVEQLEAGVLAWTSPRGRTYLTTPDTTPGTAEATLDTLDDWTTEAHSLTTEAPPTDVPTSGVAEASSELDAPSGGGSQAAPRPATAHDDPPF